MICPKCGTEYREGFSECAYCHIPLVENLEEGVDPEELYRQSEGKGDGEEGEYVTREEFLEIARSKGLSNRDILDALEEVREKEPVLPEEVSEEESEDQDYDMTVKPFKKASERVEELRSSAYTLLIVGVFGLVVTFLFYIGAIPINFSTAGRYITTITMGVMFVLFLVTGINSCRKIGALSEEAEREDKKIDEIQNFFFEAYTKEKLDGEALRGSDDGEDEYFLRTRKMKEILNARFMDLDPSFLEYMVDNIYNELYEE